MPNEKRILSRSEKIEIRRSTFAGCKPAKNCDTGWQKKRRGALARKRTGALWKVSRGKTGEKNREGITKRKDRETTKK